MEEEPFKIIHYLVRTTILLLLNKAYANLLQEMESLLTMNIKTPQSLKVWIVYHPYRKIIS